MAVTAETLRTYAEPGARAERRRIVLTTEGTYPHFTGGVSTWCDALIRGMPDTDFTIWALMMNPFVAAQYQLPPNVKDFIGVPMWGIEEPVEYTPEVPAAKVISLSRKTTERKAAEGFVPLLRALLEEIASPAFDPFRFGQLLYDIHLYFRENDYRSTFRAEATWEAAKRTLLATNGYRSPEEWDQAIPSEGGPRRDEARAHLRELFDPPLAEAPRNGSGRHLPTLNDATEGLRWLYRLLMPLNVPIPECDVIHSSAAAFCGLPAILAKIENGTPFLLTEHGVYMREQYLAIARYGFPYYLKKFIIQMIAAVSRTCFAYADQISPVCDFNARWELRNGAPPERIKTIYNGVDPVAYSPRPVARPAVPTVVMLARIDPLKDLETFLYVAKQVATQVPGVQFLQYGPAADREYDKKIKDLWRELKLERTVKFMGGTDNPAAALNQADVVLLTSISEAFPYTVIEGLMCGKPVVATEVGGVREALEGIGLLARPRDIEGLAGAVTKMLTLEPAARRELEAACRDRALNRFTLHAAIDGYRTTYDRFVEQGRENRRARAEQAERAEIARLADEAAADQAAQPEPVREPVVRRQPVVAPEQERVVQLPRQPELPAVAISEARPAISSEVPADRLLAFDATVRSGGTKAEEAVLALMNDPDPRLRKRAIQAAGGGSIGRALALGRLPAILSSDPDPEVRAAAAEAVASIFGGVR